MREVTVNFMKNELNSLKSQRKELILRAECMEEEIKRFEKIIYTAGKIEEIIEDANK